MEILKPLIDELVSLIKSGTNLAKEQLPDVAKQIIRYNIWVCVIELPLSLLILLVTDYFRRFFWALYIQDPQSNWYGGAILIGVIGYTVGIYILFSTFERVAKLVTAPKLYILEFLNDFLSKDGDSDK